jgi:carboxymethylenebutenolidase
MVAYVAFLDAQPQVDKARKIGAGLLYGRRAGGPQRRRATGADRCRRVVPRRRPGHRQAGQPALLAPRIAACMGFGVAMNDDQRQPEAKDKLKEALGSAGAGAGGG